MHAVEYLKNNAKIDLKPVIALVGEQRQFKLRLIEKLQTTLSGGEDADALQISYYQGGLEEDEKKKNDNKDNDGTDANQNASQARSGERDLQVSAGQSEDDNSEDKSPKCLLELATVLDELRTVSMWGGPRVVVIEKAGPFISEYRAPLEKYCKNPARHSCLILNVNSLPQNTRLAKQIQKTGLLIDCSTPTGSRVVDWLTYYAQLEHGKKLHADAAWLLRNLVGDDVGLLEQEIMKLASYVNEEPDIRAEHIRLLTGDWKDEVTWTMTNAIRDGQPAVALSCLQKLLNAGEAPQKILGGISYVYRKHAAAAELARQGIPLQKSLHQAGVFPRDIEPTANYMRRIGRTNVERLYERLQQADLNMKGDIRVDMRVQLEQLLVELAIPL